MNPENATAPGEQAGSTERDSIEKSSAQMLIGIGVVSALLMTIISLTCGPVGWTIAFVFLAMLCGFRKAKLSMSAVVVAVSLIFGGVGVHFGWSYYYLLFGLLFSAIFAAMCFPSGDTGNETRHSPREFEIHRSDREP